MDNNTSGDVHIGELIGVPTVDDVTAQAERGFLGAQGMTPVRLPVLHLSFRADIIKTTQNAMAARTVKSLHDAACERTELIEGSEQELRHAQAGQIQALTLQAQAETRRADAQTAQIVQATADDRRAAHQQWIIRWIAVGVSAVFMGGGVWWLIVVSQQPGGVQGADFASIVMTLLGFVGVVLPPILRAQNKS
ncbi:MAG: hypothetical protein FWD80_04640 [Propionibacteriaceae bacterium]|nr:hypothetical protein [Propionibacteriaceae bacterium]